MAAGATACQVIRQCPFQVATCRLGNLQKQIIDCGALGYLLIEEGFFLVPEKYCPPGAVTRSLSLPPDDVWLELKLSRRSSVERYLHYKGR